MLPFGVPTPCACVTTIQAAHVTVILAACTRLSLSDFHGNDLDNLLKTKHSPQHTAPVNMGEEAAEGGGTAALSAATPAVTIAPAPPAPSIDTGEGRGGGGGKGPPPPEGMAVRAEW